VGPEPSTPLPRSPPTAATSVRVPVPRLREGEHRLGAEVARYLASARRLKAGDSFIAFDPARGLEADGEVLELIPGELVARIGPLRAALLVATRAVTWIQALPKGEKMDAIVRDATELGVTCIVPVTTVFTVVKLEGTKREVRRQRWERIAREAARQCGRSDAPEVRTIATWAEALESAYATGFCLYERGTAPLGPLLQGALAAPGPIAFAAGPEGGFAEEEIAQASEKGFQAVSLGPFTLRAETVAAATLGALRVLEGSRGT
jgi:16S rRNA (uracil1498-N3)-methyltransferase